MSMTIGQKMRVMRESEQLNRRQTAELIGVPYGSLNHYESGRMIPSTDISMKLLQHPKFQKYTLWFMTDETAPESGQIAPALVHCGQDETTSQHSDQKIG